MAGSPFSEKASGSFSLILNFLYGLCRGYNESE